MPQIKFFTPAEANRMLPLIRGIVGDILKTGHAIRALSATTEKLQDDKEVNSLVDQMDELFGELEKLGCSYRDWNFTEGLVDFPAVINGQEVLLCWRSDEKEILYYHDIESGYAGRLPIPK